MHHSDDIQAYKMADFRNDRLLQWL